MFVFMISCLFMVITAEFNDSSGTAAAAVEWVHFDNLTTVSRNICSTNSSYQYMN